jgi:hypothetical protein
MVIAGRIPFRTATGNPVLSFLRFLLFLTESFRPGRVNSSLLFYDDNMGGDSARA